jgi:hypothetical protein
VAIIKESLCVAYCHNLFDYLGNNQYRAISPFFVPAFASEYLALFFGLSGSKMLEAGSMERRGQSRGNQRTKGSLPELQRLVKVCVYLRNIKIFIIIYIVIEKNIRITYQ